MTQEAQEITLCSQGKKSSLHHISSPISHPPITPISVSITYLNCGEPDDEAIDARADSPGSCGNEAL